MPIPACGRLVGMSDKAAPAPVKPFLERLGDGVVVFDGAMGTMLYARGVFVNRCFDELNLSNPNLVRSIHEEYLAAGAEVVETNTFGAHRFKLGPHGLAPHVRKINREGARVAREAAAGRGLVAGSHRADREASGAAGSRDPGGGGRRPTASRWRDSSREGWTCSSSRPCPLSPRPRPPSRRSARSPPRSRSS